jgi:hypothetical protein
MTRRISLIIGTALVALTVAVPAAFGEGRLAGSLEPQATEVSRPDSHDVIRTQETTYLDAADRARRIDIVVPTAFTDSFDRAEPPKGSLPITVAATPDTGLEWPQLGVGFGLGMILITGLWLATRTTRDRQLAH